MASDSGNFTLQASTGLHPLQPNGCKAWALFSRETAGMLQANLACADAVTVATSELLRISIWGPVLHADGLRVSGQASHLRQQKKVFLAVAPPAWLVSVPQTLGRM